MFDLQQEFFMGYVLRIPTKRVLNLLWFWHMRQLSHNKLLTFHTNFSSPLFLFLFMTHNTVDVWGRTLNYYQLKCTWRTISILWWFCVHVPFIAVVAVVDIKYMTWHYWMAEWQTRYLNSMIIKQNSCFYFVVFRSFEIGQKHVHRLFDIIVSTFSMKGEEKPQTLAYVLKYCKKERANTLMI